MGKKEGEKLKEEELKEENLKLKSNLNFQNKILHFNYKIGFFVVLGLLVVGLVAGGFFYCNNKKSTTVSKTKSSLSGVKHQVVSGAITEVGADKVAVKTVKNEVKEVKIGEKTTVRDSSNKSLKVSDLKKDDNVTITCVVGDDKTLTASNIRIIVKK